MPPAPVDSIRLRASRDFSLLASEGGQHFALLMLGDLELIQGAAQLCRDLVADGRRDLQVIVRIAQLSASVEKRSSCD